MKKLFLGLLLVVAALGLSACGKKEDDVLQKMEAANTNETLLKNNEKVAFRETHYPADGAAESTWLYQDAKRYVFENDYGVFIDEDGDVYGLDKEENVKYRYLFVDNAYEEFKYNWEWLAGYVYSPEEELLFSEEKDGMLYISTELCDIEDYVVYLSDYGYEPDQIDKILFSYEVDAKTLELQAMKNMLRTKDGEEILFYENMRVLDCEIYTPDEQMRKDIFEGELRSVTVTVYEGTNKLTYTQSIAMKGGEITIYLPTSYEQVLYLDEECTQVYTGGEDLSSTKEFILYAKSPK